MNLAARQDVQLDSKLNCLDFLRGFEEVGNALAGARLAQPVDLPREQRETASNQPLVARPDVLSEPPNALAHSDHENHGDVGALHRKFAFPLVLAI